MSASLDPLRLPLQGTRLIEASAGTGKTFTIAALYLRLVLGHGDDETGFGRPLVPPEILVVTYTDAATKELRDRIRKRLAAAAAHFRSALEKPDELLESLRVAYPQGDWPACARRLELAAEWMDEAAVSTIHAWCRRMLREHAFDSGSLFAQELEADSRELRNEVVRDYWRLHCYPLSGDALTWVLAQWQTPEALAKKLVAEPQDALLSSLGELFERIRGERQAVLAREKAPWAAWVPEVRAILEEGMAKKVVDGRKIQTRYFEPWLAALSGWSADPEAVGLDLGKGWQRLSPEGMAEAWKGEPPRHAAFEAIPELQRSLAALPDFRRDMLLHASFWVRRRFDEEKARRAEMDFDDLLTHLEAALRGGSGERLAATMRKQFPVALIDEFQDTDPIQYAIFSRIYGGQDGTALFMIGDPKQAIYAFRNADIHTYLEAKRATEGRHHTLLTNFRATEAMVAAVNRVFCQAEERGGAGAFLFRRGASDPMPFLPAVANGRKERLEVAGEAQPALTLWSPEAQDAPMGRTEYRQRMAEIAAGGIVRLLNLGQEGQCGFAEAGKAFEAVRPGDVAVLVRDGRQAAAVRKALSARLVKSVYLSDKDSVAACDEAGDVLALLSAAAEPEDSRLLRAALACRLLGLALCDLEVLNQDEVVWEDRVLQFRRYRAIWQTQGVLPMLRRMLHDFQLPRRLGERVGGERSLTNFLHLSELLQQWSGEVEGEQALIRRLSEAMAEESGDEERILRLESDENLVQVVTIHKSKGLEYPLVFMPFACHYRGMKKDEAVVKFHDGEGRPVTVVAPNEEQIRLADRERLEEDLRLMYVALTRARHACWLGVADVKTGNVQASDLHQSAFGSLLLGAESLKASSDLPELLQALKGASPDIVLAPWPDTGEERFRPGRGRAGEPQAREMARPAAGEPWWIASYSALRVAGGEEGLAAPAAEPESLLAQKLAEADAEVPARPEAGGIHGFPRGAAPGTFLHALLEWAADEGFSPPRDKLERLVARQCERHGWKEWTDPLVAWLADLLETPLPAGDAAPVLSDLTNLRAELEFWFEANGVATAKLDALVSRHTLSGVPRPGLEPDTLSGMLKGYMDLVFEWQGRYYVLDYKSNWLGADDAAYTATAMGAAILEKRYDLQYALYLLALHRQLKARLPGYDFDTHVGGALYVFLRGTKAPTRGAFFERPPKALIEAMDRLFAGDP